MTEIRVCEHGNPGDCAKCKERYLSSTHGIKTAYYANLTGRRQTALIECLCGAELSGNTSSWEDAGFAMDLHLAAFKDRAEVKD